MEQQGRLEQLLEQLVQPNTEKVKEATAALSNDFSSDPTALLILLKILTTESKANGIRQLAGVEARKRVANLWPEVDDANKPAIRTKILEFSISSPTKSLRHAAAQIIAEIGAHDLEHGEWTDLPNLLLQASNSSTALHREMGLYIILTLIEESPEMFMSDINSVIQVLQSKIQDPESADVRLNALAIFAAVAPVIEVDENPDTIATIQTCVPSMVAVLKDSIDSEEEERSIKCFEAFQQILEGSPAFFQKHFSDLIHFMLQILTNKEVDQDIRLQAVNFLAEAVTVRKMRIQALRLGEEISIKALQVVVEMDDFDDEEGERNPASQCLALLDLLAAALPPNQVVLPLLKAVGQYSSDSNPAVRRAGILGLSMCVEGAPDFFSTQLKEITPLVLTLLNDSEPVVRGAALKCVARLAEDLSEDIGVLHETIIPAVVHNFDLAITAYPQATGKAQEDFKRIVLDCCIALDAIMAGMEKENTAKYLSELIPRLSKLLEQDDFKYKICALSALGAIAESAEEGFLPYFKDAMHGLGAYMTKKESEEELDIRRATTEAMGKFALAVGAEPFKEFVPRLMEVSEESLHLDNANLKEQSYILWSQLAKVYEEEFEPFLDGVAKGLLASLEQDEATALSDDAEETIQKIMAAMENKRTSRKEIDDILETADIGEGEMIEDVEDLDFDGSPVSAIALEKEIALEAIGDVLTHTKGKYLPYFERTIETVLKLVEHSYPGITSSALGCLWRAYGTLWELETERGMAKWQAGLPLKIEPSNELKKLADVSMKATLGAWTSQDDRNTVSDINRILADTLVLCGPAPLVGENVVAQITNQLISIITKKHVCQMDFFADDDEEEESEESSEYDWLVIETAMDCLVALSKALGSDFAELWKLFEKPVLKHASASEANERSVATGTVAECIYAMGNAVTPYTSSLLKIALHRFSDEDPITKGNSIYAVGLLCNFSKDDALILKNYNTILNKLEPLLADDTEGHLLDNAAGCVARMIIAHPEKVPLEQVLPRLVELAPAKEDWEVNGPLFRCIIGLYQAENAIIRQLTPQVITAVKKVLSEPEEHLDEDTRGQVNELVEYLKSKGAN